MFKLIFEVVKKCKKKTSALQEIIGMNRKIVEENTSVFRHKKEKKKKNKTIAVD